MYFSIKNHRNKIFNGLDDDRGRVTSKDLMDQYDITFDIFWSILIILNILVFIEAVEYKATSWGHEH